jgi:hypothetical protein
MDDMDGDCLCFFDAFGETTVGVHLGFLWGPHVFLRAGTCQVSIVNGDPRRCRELV